MKLGDDYKPRKDSKLTGHQSIAELWILSKFNRAVIETNKNLDQFNFMQATMSVYQFWLYELCDVYLVTSFSVY